jgi:DNA helicase-2/ATP-dependent DNA helicase PcrA
VLFRTSSHSAQLELELARRDIPFVKFGGLRFLEAAHIKDVLSVLRWADNPRNRLAGFRVARLLPGVGPVAATRLLDAMDEAPDPLSAMAAFDAPAASRADCQALHELFAQLRRSQSPWPTEMEQVIAWYEPHLQRIYDDEHMRRADLAQLQQIAVTYRSRERFLTEVTLDPPSATSAEADAPGLDDDYLVLSTIHSAKGQEWNTVHVLNVVDGCIPSDMSTGTTAEVEEERRLLYVAMTRAKNHLHLMVPQRFHVTQQSVHGDRHVYASRSRFLPNSICKYFQFTAWPVAEQSDGTGRGASVSAPSVDISSRIREFWR